MRFIDLFAGCGGLSLGLTKAGWKGVFAVEESEDAFKTFSHNFNKKNDLKFDWPKWLPQQAISTVELLEEYSDELIHLVEESHLSARLTLAKLGIPRTTFYRPLSGISDALPVNGI